MLLETSESSSNKFSAVYLVCINFDHHALSACATCASSAECIEIFSDQKRPVYLMQRIYMCIYVYIFSVRPNGRMDRRTNERTIALATTTKSGAFRVIDPPRRAAPPDIWDEADRSLVWLPKRFFFPPWAQELRHRRNPREKTATQRSPACAKLVCPEKSRWVASRERFVLLRPDPSGPSIRNVPRQTNEETNERTSERPMRRDVTRRSSSTFRAFEPARVSIERANEPF